MTDNSQTPTTNSSTDHDQIKLRSPYRPYPLGAKKELKENVDTIEFSEEDPRLAFASEKPDQELMEDWELTIIRTDDPVETWVTDHNEQIKIYEDRVERDGAEVPIDPEEAMEKAREQDHFTRQDSQDD